jgi:DNA polymerase-3 subunit delta'
MTFSKAPSSPYPWQEQQWQHITTQWQQLPHGLLFAGQSGLGVDLFAKKIAKALLCQHSITHLAICNDCRSCHWVDAQTHSDLIVVSPDEAGKPIKVDSIREAIQQVLQTGHVGQRRVILIEPAEAMNVAASNALLKTLEEPPQGVYLLLTCHHPSQLLPTVRSRCQTIQFYPSIAPSTVQWLKAQAPDVDNLEELLQQHQGLPLQALQFLREDQQQMVQKLHENLLALRRGECSLTELATQCLTWPLTQVLEHMMSLTSSMIGMIMLAHSRQQQDTLLMSLSQGIHLSALYAYYDFLVEQRKMPMNNLSQPLMLDAILVHWNNLQQRGQTC